MVHFNGINSITSLDVSSINNAKEGKASSVNSAFGEGFATSENKGFVVDSRFQNLAIQFDIETPKYPKGGFAQFNPTEADYQTMKHLDAVLDKAEPAYCEC